MSNILAYNGNIVTYNTDFIDSEEAKFIRFKFTGVDFPFDPSEGYQITGGNDVYPEDFPGTWVQINQDIWDFYPVYNNTIGHILYSTFLAYPYGGAGTVNFFGKANASLGNNTKIQILHCNVVIHKTGLGSKMGLFEEASYITNVNKLAATGYVSRMFRNCENLYAVSDLNLSANDNLSQMFDYEDNYGSFGPKLRYIDTNLDLSSATNTSNMFHNQEKLPIIPRIKSPIVTNVDSMFLNCRGVLEGAYRYYEYLSNLSTIPSSHVETFKNCGDNDLIPSDWK